VQETTAADVARQERRELCDLFLEVGPDAPTLCAGWLARDLAAHLVLRESRPDAALGIVVRPLAGHTKSVQERIASRPWPELVRDVRTGPPLYSPFRLPGVQGRANLFEFTVHHEDVRRARPGWEPRRLPAGEQDILWSHLTRAGRMFTRSSPVGIELRRSDVADFAVISEHAPMVMLKGEPLELLLRLNGRREVLVDVEGTADAIASFESGRFGG
jgi:uncharacterized protein (TIGR03085 family)